MNLRIGTIAIACALVVAFTLCAQAPPRENLLPNPGFEVPKDNWVESWLRNAEAETGTITLDDQVKRSGKYSVHMKYNPAGGPKASGYLQITNTPSPRYVPGTTYTFSAYVKTKDLGNTAYLCAYQNPAPIPEPYMHSVRAGGATKDWTRITLTFTARKDITSVVFFCGVHCVPGQLKGEAWFDDCKLEEGPNATEYTDAWKTEFYAMGPKPSEFPLSYDFQVSLDYVTPFAAPSVGLNSTKTPVLFAWHWATLRDVVELTQRADIQPVTVALSYGDTGQIYIESARQLRTRLSQDPKALVIRQDTWELLLTEDRDAIEKRIRQGMGLVFYKAYAPGKRMAELLAKATAMPGYPNSAPPNLQVRQLGQGKIALIGEPHTGSNTYSRELDYDRAVRAIYAATGRAVATLKLTTLPEVPPAGQTWKLAAKSAVGEQARLRVRVRPTILAGSGVLLTLPIPVLQETTVPFPGSAEVEMSPLPAGGYFVESSVLDNDGGVPAWQLLPVVCDGPLRIWSATGDDLVLRAGKETAVRVLLENNSGAEQPVVLRPSLSDTQDRLLARPDPISITLAPGRSERLLKISAAHSATPMARLILDLDGQGARLDRRVVGLSAEPLLREPDFRFVVYADFWRGCLDLGADTSVVSGSPEWGMRSYPWIDVMPTREGSARYGLKPEDVITSPDALRKSSKGLTDALRANLPFRTVGIMLQDEWSHVFAPSPHHLAYFKQFLRKSYGTVEALNRSWGAALKSFDEVSFDSCATGAIRDKDASPVPWADLQTAMERAVADFAAGLRTAALEVDPEARIGLSGTQEPTATSGLDYGLLANSFRSMACYGGVNVLLLESFRQPDSRIYQWSYACADRVGRARHDPWRDLFHQRDGYLHFGGSFTPIFMPDYRPFPVGEVFREEFEAMRQGPARLIRGSKREAFGVAVLYSVPSWHASALPAIRRTGADHISDVLYSTEGALADARLDSRFVSCEQLAGGLVTPKEFKVLMLPYAQALSAAEAKAVRQFAESGGVVVADVRPGVYDEHCKKLVTGALDDVFGVGPVGAGPTLASGSLKPGTDYGPLSEATVLMGESDLRLAGAAARAQVAAKDKTAPAVVVNTVGKGKAVLLNFLFPSYNKHRAAGTGGEVSIEKRAKEAAAVRDLLGKVLSQEAQVLPVARLLAADNTEMRGVRMFVYRDGPAAYVGLLPEYTWTEGVKPIIDGRLVLTQPGELYDVRAGEYLGRSGSAAVKVQETYAKLYAVLPYKVEALSLDAPRDAQAGKGIPFKARLKTTGGPVGRHVIVARLQRPDGSERRWDRMTFDAPGGAAECLMPLALNDPPGEWKLFARDAATGASAEAVVTVKAGP